MSLKIDSGAIDTVIPPHVAKSFATKATDASRAGIGYRAANGSKIPAYGERQVKGFTDCWLPFSIKTQVAGVKSPLGSVMHMIRAGNRLTFDSQGSFMVNKKSGQKLPIHERDGGFEMDLWIKNDGQNAGNGLDHVPNEGVEVRNRYQELDQEPEDNDCEIDMGFMGLV